jgi:DNA-directed RNA polymerase II subunit RPB4
VGSTKRRSRNRQELTTCRTITHFLDYLENFSRYKQEESLHSIAALFEAHPELTTVERALLGTR